jgi:hypothetical protein
LITYEKKWYFKIHMNKEKSIIELSTIPGIGKSMANDLSTIGISSIKDLIGKKPEDLFNSLNTFVGCKQDRCVLYAFKCAVYYASTPKKKLNPEKLKWWNWKDNK